MVVGKALNSRILHIGESPVNVSYLVSLIVATGGCSQGRRYASYTKDGISHPCPPVLIREYLHTIDKTLHGLVLVYPLPSGRRKIKTVMNRAFQDRFKGNRRPCVSESLGLTSEELALLGNPPRGEPLGVGLDAGPSGPIGIPLVLMEADWLEILLIAQVNLARAHIALVCSPSSYDEDSLAVLRQTEVHRIQETPL